MNRYGKRCVLYPRVSTEMQVDGYSLEGQKNMLTRFADREEMIVVDTYEDAGKSGKSIEGRPAFQKMLRDIEDGLDIDYILVYKLSRFGRNAADILNSLELVQSYGVNLICIEEGIDSSQTSGKLLISVLSAVAEIERENIIEQTMNGRREKARQGGWNGGFAPYGYTLEDNKLMIEETEAVAIRKIFELYTSSEIGLGGIANQLNLQGIRKIPRQNGTLEDWTGHFIKLILDNPVYCGKIAYGRRTKEKVKGTKNDYQMKRNDDYILTEGQHKGIVSEEVWEKAHAKRLRTGVKQPSKIGRDRVHLLSGLLKCPVCGSPMYTNKHAWTNKDGTYKEIYYYVCSRNRMVRGKHCEYKAMLKKTDIEPMVIEAIREIVRNEEYAQAIKKRIGVQIDTKAVDKELEGYQAKLKEVDLNKTRLEREIDSLPADAKYRERKLHDMTLRLDSLYDVIVELEEKIEDAKLRRDAIKQQAITLENIYKIMVNFDCVYNIINDEEKRNVVTALIKEIEIYRNDESEYPLKRIGLNFPVFKDGGEVTELLWDKGNTVDTDSLLHSEFGCDGMSSMQTVARTLSKCPAKPERMKDNDLWRFHGDWWCTYDREEAMFGHVEDIRRYIRLSQWMQAEGLRFILESNQRRKWHNSGSIIWQLSEPWPNLSCTSIVDYYGHEKQAYYWTKDAFAPLHPTLDYRRLDYTAGTAVELPLTVLTDSGIAGNAEVAWSVRGLGGATYAEETRTAHLAAAAVNRVGDVAFVMPQTADGLVLVRLTVRLGERTAANEYYFSCENNRPYRAAASLHGGHLTARALETSPDSAVIEVRNTGDTAVLFADITDASDEWNLVRDDNFRTLLPGERWQTRVQWSRRFRIGFDDFTAHTTERPILTVDGIGLDAPVLI